MTSLRQVHWLSMALFVLLPLSSDAQQRNLGSVRPLGVRVHVRAATIVGDTVTLGYAVENVRAGGEDFSALLVATPAQVVRIPKPARFDWVTHPRYRKQNVAIWVLVEDEMLHPGQTSPDLTLVARGLPDVVRYWAVPDLEAHPPRYVDEDNSEDSYFVYSDTGRTVGIVPMPTGATPAALAARLRALATTACGQLAWIDRPGVCRSLDVKLAHAEAAIVSGQATVARDELGAFVAELDAQHGPHPGKAVSDEAHALLALNAAFLLSRL
jgi:hypothetical protein